MITARHIRLLALALTTFFIAPNAWSGACGTHTSSSVTAIPFDFYVVKNKGRWITLSATSNDIEWNNLNEGWPTRYKAFKYGGGSAIREWKLDSLPTHGDLYEGTTKLSAGSTISDPDELYFVPELNFTGNDAFGYCVTDSSGRSSVAEVKLNTSNAASYPMPLGMPRPDFGINEEPPEDPVEWPSSEATGFYYIDSDASNCSDANTYGWPDQPRCTIETNATIEAGRKMVLARSALPYQLRSGLTWDQIYLNGTADNPAWLVGEDRLPDKPKITLGPGLSRQELRLQGTGNYRITGIDFDGANPNNRGVGDNVVIRYSRVQNFPSTGGGGTSVGLSSGDGPGTNVLAFHVNANDNGIVSSTLEEERDIHAFVGSNQHNFWMLDIMCSENAGDCVQLTNGNTTENVYVGRAIMHSMMENCTDFKDFHNFVVTESSCWDIRNVAYTSGSGGNAQNFYVNDEGVQQGYGYILNNRSWDTSGTGFGSSNIGGKVYFIGNRSFFSPYASGLGSANGGGERHYYFNTVYDALIGMDMYVAGSPVRYVAGNYFGKIGQYGSFVSAAYSEIDSFDYNVYDENALYAWGSNKTPKTGVLMSFQSATHYDAHSIEIPSPGFMNANQHDYRIVSSSALKDRVPRDSLAVIAPGLTSMASDLGIRFRDFTGTLRSGDNLDVGADEFASTLAPPMPPVLQLIQ